MNSSQIMVMAILQDGAMCATDVLAALRRRGRQLSIEALYVELVSLEANEHVRVEGIYDGCGNRVCGAWALGRASAPVVPDFEPAPRVVDDLMRSFARPTLLEESATPPPGVTIHRCI